VQAILLYLFIVQTGNYWIITIRYTTNKPPFLSLHMRVNV
jgi:hypothetical protein